MLFNSLSFAVFLPLVFLLYWLLSNKSYRLQNMLLLAASYFFYGCWDVRFLGLLAFSTFLDYYSGLQIAQASKTIHKKIWFWTSVGVNLGFLGFFKYYNFFVDSFATGLTKFGMHIDTWTLNVILPVGISFYTFHGLSYVIDIYNNRIQPERNFVDYAVFVSFFPLLVAGPIERATHLLPQLKTKRSFNYTQAVDGLRQILWGLCKKIIIADTCAQYANLIFDHSDTYSGSTLVVGAVLFAFQIYGDFSGYSDIALGTARLFGIELLQNFRFPYFSRDIAEFWRRWHISLSSWFKDYLYIPLGGSQGSTWLRIRNTLIIFIVSGFWHGANWTFIIWGALNAVYILPSIIFKTNRNHLAIVAQGKVFPTIKETAQVLFTFGLTVLAWIFFRAKSVSHAVEYIGTIFSKSVLSIPEVKPPLVFVVLILFILMEWRGRTHNYALEKTAFTKPKWVRWTLYLVLIGCLFQFAGQEQAFIYFQF
ncbi:MAG: MBOAT family O-acyltransferase [Flavobacterium psychrophilum]